MKALNVIMPALSSRKKRLIFESCIIRIVAYRFGRIACSCHNKEEFFKFGAQIAGILAKLCNETPRLDVAKRL